MCEVDFCKVCNFTPKDVADMLSHVHSADHEAKRKAQHRDFLMPNILDYLSRQRVSMWGRTYYLHDDDGIQKAAEWLLSVIEEVQNARSNVEFHPGSPRTDVSEVPEPIDGRSSNSGCSYLHLGAFLRSSHD